MVMISQLKLEYKCGPFTHIRENVMGYITVNLDLEYNCDIKADALLTVSKKG